MNKREKSLFITIVILVVLFAHFWGVKKFMTYENEKKNLVAQLESQAASHSNSAAVAEAIADEVEWLSANEPTPSSYGETQSNLVKFLNDSGRANGFEPVQPKLIPIENSGGKYRRVKVQITATAKETEIYKWLISIHQPSKFRAVTQILMKPTAKDDENIICTLTAEQWLIDSEQFTSEETGE